MSIVEQSPELQKLGALYEANQRQLRNERPDPIHPHDKGDACRLQDTYIDSKNNIFEGKPKYPRWNVYDAAYKGKKVIPGIPTPTKFIELDDMYVEEPDMDESVYEEIKSKKERLFTWDEINQWQAAHEDTSIAEENLRLLGNHVLDYIYRGNKSGPFAEAIPVKAQYTALQAEGLPEQYIKTMNGFVNALTAKCDTHETRTLLYRKGTSMNWDKLTVQDTSGTYTVYVGDFLKLIRGKRMSTYYWHRPIEGNLVDPVKLAKFTDQLRRTTIDGNLVTVNDISISLTDKPFQAKKQQPAVKTEANGKPVVKKEEKKPETKPVVQPVVQAPPVVPVAPREILKQLTVAPKPQTKKQHARADFLAL